MFFVGNSLIYDIARVYVYNVVRLG